MGWRERAREEQEEGYEFMRRMGFTPFSEKKARAEAAENNRRPVEPEVGVWDTNLTRRTQSAINPTAVTDPLYDAALRKAENDMPLVDRQSRTRALLEQTARDINSQKADAYTNSYRNGKTISNDFGNERIKEMNDTKSGYLLDNYMSGGANFMGGLANVPLALGDIVTGGKFDWDNTDIRKNPTANIDLLNEAMYEADKDGTPLPKFAGDLAQSAGQLVPQMLIGAGTGLGTELMAAGVFGNEYKQNRKDDMSVLASAANAGLKAGSEYVTEKLLGVLGKGAFKTVSKIAPKVTSNPIWTKFANSYGGKIAEGFTGEFAEEAVQEPISLLIDKITGKEVSEEDIKNLPQNMLYSGLLGGITGGAVSGVAGLPHIGLNKRIEETGKQFNNTDTVNSIVSKGLESDKKGGFYRTAEALKKKLDTNQKITDYEVGNLIFNADEQTIDRLYNPMGENGEKQYNAQLKRRQSAQNGEVQQGDFEQEFGYYYRAGKDDVPYDKVPEYAGERSMDDVARAGAYYSGQNDMQAEADTLGTETNARRFYENVDKVFKGEISEREVIKIGKTPQILQDYGAKDLPITINQSTMYKIAYPKDYFGAKDQGHNLGIPSLKRLPSQIADPVAILKSKSQDNSLVLLTAWKDTNKYPVIVPLHLDKNSIIGMSNDIVSAYGKQNFNALLTDEKGNSTVLYTKNNEDIHQLLQSGLQLPGVVSDDTLINKIISQDGENVNNIVNWDINGAKGSGEYIGTVENNGKRFARVKMQNGKTADIDMAFVSDVDNVDNVVADTKNVPSDTKNVYSDTEKAVSKSESKTSTTEKTASAAERNISPRVTKKQRRFFDKLSKVINTPIEFVDSIKSPSGQAANGAYVNGKIILAEDSDRPLIEVAKHEITHMLKENAPKEYAAYESYAIEALKKNGRYDDLYREYSELYGTDNESAINEELAADATQMFLTDEAAINELAQENPSLAKKFLDCIRGFIEKIKSIFADGGIDEVTASFETEQLKHAEKLWIKAIAAAEKGQSGNSESKYMFAGKNAATADLSALATAEKMEQSGSTPEEIWTETGWSKGQDGKWRFEIDDSNFKIKADNLAEIHRNYKEIAQKENLIYRLENMSEQERKNRELGFTLLGLDEKYKTVDDEISKLKQDISELSKDKKTEIINGAIGYDLSDLVEGYALFEAYPDLKNVQVLISNSNELGKDNRGEWNRKNNTICLNGDYSVEEIESTLLHEIQHAIQSKEGFARGATPEYWQSKIYNVYNDKQFNKDAKTLYKNTAGEIEARDVQTRRNMTAEERRNTFPESMKKRDDAVFADDSVYSSDYVGKNKYGIEVYETSDDVKKLSYQERMQRFVDIMENQYSGRTAKFTRNGHTYYARFEAGDIRKNVYGDKRSDKKGWRSKINVGADGNVFELVENATYERSEAEKGKSTKAHKNIKYWDYFIKTVQIDNKVFDLVANVRKTTDNQYVYSLQLNENKKTIASPPLGTENSSLNRVLNATVNNSITENGGNVNSEIKFSLKKPVEETKDLIAVHNLTPEKLKGILELGGFPVPSIAIIKADMEHSGYGDISVLFGKDTIDPESDSRNDVFSADAYTSRFPQIDIKLKNGELKKIADRLNTSVSMLEANEFSRSTKEDIISDLKGNRNARETFLKENEIKVEPVLRMPEYTKSVHKRKAVSDFIARKDVTFEKLVNDDTVREEYMSAIKTAFGERKSMSGVPLAEKWCTMITEILDKCKNDRFLFETEEKRFNTDKSIANNTAVPVEDAYSYIDGVDNAISDYGAEFDVWLNELVEPAIGEKYVRKDIEAYKNNGDRRSFNEMHDAYTLENIVKNMSRGTNNESGFGPAGIGELRAATSTRFGSIGDVRAAKSKIQNLTDEQIQNIYEAATEKLSEVRSELYKYHQYKSGIDLNNVVETIKDAFVQYTDENDVIEYLKEYYPKAPKSTFDMVIDLKKTLENLPVKYFEAKPHRAIGFDEVKAVVVPDDIDSSLKQELNNAGLNVIEYEKGNSRSRVDAVNSVDDIKFQLRRQESLERQNEKLRAINDSLREQFYLTEGVKVNRKQIDTAARKFLADIHSKADKSEFSERLAGIYDTLANSNYDNEAYTAAMYELEKLTSDALHKSETIDDTLYKQYADLREHIRTTGITANESAKSDFGGKEDWNDFRKSNFGRIKIVNDGLPVDVFYKELSEMYPEWFSDEIQTQSDQLIRIANVLDGIKPVYENPYLMDIDEMSKTAAYELFTEFFGMGDQTTFADRKQAQMNNLKIKTKSQIAGLRQEYKTRNTKNILAQREKYQEHIRKLIDERDEKIKEIKLADSMHYGAEIANLKRTYNDKMKGQAEHYKGRISDTIARKNEKIEEVRQYYQERIDRLKTLKNARIALEHDRYTQYKEKTKERAAVREFKKKIKKDWYALSDMLLKPTDKKHIPEKMRDAIANVLNTIDIRSGFKNKDGTDTKVALKLNNLYDKFKSFEQNPDTESMLEVMNPDFFANFEELKKSFNGNEITIQDMTSKQLEQVAGIIRDVKHCVQNANRSFADKQKRDISEIVKAIISDLRTKGVRVDKGKFDWSSDVKGKFKDIEFGMLTPLSFAHQLGENFEGVYWQMRKGLNEKVRMIKTATDYLADIKKRYKINIKNISGKKAERINFTVESGERISMNKAEIMSLYLLNKREQGQKHIYGGGITLEPEIEYVKEGKKKVAKIKAEKRPVQVTERDVRNITGTLSENERAFADMLGKFLSEDCSEWGNEVSMKLYGYKKFVEQFYFPLNSDKNYLVERFNNADDIASIKNMGFTKQTNAFANNPVIISDVFDVFCRHVDDMSTYGALALPVNDFQRIYNFKDKSVSLKGEIESAYGAAAKKYITDFMRSVNGMSTKSMTGTLPSKLVGNVKAAAVGWNLRVVIQQPTAILRATSMIDAKYFVQNVKNISVEEMQKHSAIALYKSWGNYSLDMGRQVKEVITDEFSVADKIKEAGMWGAGKADDVTWSVIFNAVKNEIADTRKDLSVGSKAYWEAVEDRFDRIIDETQVVDSVFHRSALMRNEDGLMRQIMSFMGEPTQSYNMVRRSAYDLYKNATPENKRKVLRAVSAFAVTTVVNSAIKSIVDSIRDDDDEKNFLEKWFKYFISGLWQEPFSMIPIVKDIVSIAQGYNVDRMDMSGIADIISSVTRAIKGGQTAGYSGFDIILSAVNASGIGAKNMFRELKSVEKMIIGSAEKVGADTDWIEYNLLKAKFNINNSKNRTKFYAQLYEAYDKGMEKGDLSTAKRILEDMVLHGIPVSGAVRNLDSRDKKALSKDKELVKIVEKAKTDKMAAVGMLSEFEKKNEGRYDDKIVEAAIKMIQKGISDVNYTPEDIYKTKQTNPKKALEMYYTLIELGFYKREDLDIALEIIKRRKARQ